MFTDGFETLTFSGSADASLVQVRLLGDPALELTGVALAGPARRIGSVQLLSEFPPKDPRLGGRGNLITDAVGYPMRSDTRDDIGWELLLGMRAAEPGRHVRTGIEVTYDVAGERYTEVIPAALAVCAGGADIDLRDCELPDMPAN